MAVTLSNADKALKTVYLDVIANQLDKYTSPLLSRIKTTTDSVYGKEVKKLVMHGLNGGIGAGSEDGALPKSKGNQYAQITSTLKNLYGTIEISDKAIRASQNSASTFVNLLNAEMEGLVKSSKFNFGRMVHGDGSGMLFYILGIENGVILCDDVTKVQEGMIVDVCDFYTGEPETDGQGRTVLKVDRENKTVTLSGTTLEMGVNIKGDSIVCIQGSCYNEITGLDAIFNPGISKLYGLSKESNPWLKAQRFSAGTKIDDLSIQKVIDNIELTSGNTINMIICSYAARRKFKKAMSTSRTYLDNQDFGYGFNGINFNGIPMVADRFCPSDVMYFINTDDFELHQLCDWQWLEDDNGAVLKQVPGKPVYTATLVKYAELVCSNPAGQGCIYGINNISE